MLKSKAVHAEALSFATAGKMVRITDDTRKDHVCRVEISQPETFGSDILWFTDGEVRDMTVLDGQFQDLAVGSSIVHKLANKKGRVLKFDVVQFRVRSVDVDTPKKKERVEFIMPRYGKEYEWYTHTVFVEEHVYQNALKRAEKGTDAEKAKFLKK